MTNQVNETLDDRIDSLGKRVRELQKVIFEIGYFGDVTLPNGNSYEICEDTKSYHPFNSIKRLNPPEHLFSIDISRLHMSKGTPVELLHDFVSDFDMLFVSVQREKIKQRLLEDDQTGQLYLEVLEKAENLLSKYKKVEGVQPELKKKTSRKKAS